MENKIENPREELPRWMTDLAKELHIDLKDMTLSEIEKALADIDPQWLDEIQLSDEWLSKH